MKPDSLTSALFKLSDATREAYSAAKDAGNVELAAELHRMGWTIASALAKCCRAQSEGVAS